MSTWFVLYFNVEKDFGSNLRASTVQTVVHKLFGQRATNNFIQDAGAKQAIKLTLLFLLTKSLLLSNTYFSVKGNAACHQPDKKDLAL